MVVHELGIGIVSGRHAEGAVLPGDAELMARFGISRTVLREALKTLSGKGLVQAKARIGTRVRDRSDWNLFDSDVLIWHARAGFAPGFLAYLGEMRLALEPEAAMLAALRRTPAQLQEIFRWLEKMGSSGATADSFANADLGFHLAVAEAAANPFFRSISTLIEVALVALLTISSPVESAAGLADSIAQHRAIAEAIAAGQAEAARAAMRVVVQRGVDRLDRDV
ncbi:MAG TPA: FadR/GntR family transcriptional regulator [Devosiaceae bacterium]